MKRIIRSRIGAGAESFAEEPAAFHPRLEIKSGDARKPKNTGRNGYLPSVVRVHEPFNLILTYPGRYTVVPARIRKVEVLAYISIRLLR